MGILWGDDEDGSPIGKYHSSTWGDGIKDKAWDPNDWNAPKGDDGKAPWNRKGGWDW